MGPDFDYDGVVDNAQCNLQIKSSWIPNVNAGGSRNDFQLFATNPKFKLTVIHPTNQVIVPCWTWVGLETCLEMNPKFSRANTISPFSQK